MLLLLRLYHECAWALTGSTHHYQMAKRLRAAARY